MKHIFLIHSHTLLLTSLGVIEKEKISPKDIIFVFSRNYKCIIPLRYQSFDFSKEVEDTFYIMLSFSRKHFFYNQRNRERAVDFFDDFIEKYAPNGFFLYVCQLQAYVSQILATNYLCRECYFIQEGGRSMMSLLTDHISLFCRIYNMAILYGEKRLWKMSNWFPSSKTPYNKQIIAYAFDKNYFGTMPKEIRMVKWPNIKIEKHLDTKRPIFLLEGAVELGQIERSLYERSVERLVSEFASDKNYIKFHPKNSLKAKERYKSFFEKKGLEVEELPMDVPFELILTNYQNLNLYGFGTSLLFYGKALGHNVTSREEYLMGSMRYRFYVKGLQKLES